MKRALMAAASSLLVFSWLTGTADAQPEPRLQPTVQPTVEVAARSQQTFTVQGEDARRGPYVGRLTLTQRADGQVDATRQLTFADGTHQTQSGVLKRRGQTLRGVLRTLAGAAGRLAGRAGATSIVALSINEVAGTLSGQTLSGRSASRFQGARVRPDPTTAPVVAPDPIDPHDPADFTGDTFAGKPVVDYDPAVGIKDPKNVAYRVKVTWQNEDKFDELVDALLADPKLPQLEALSIGYWGQSDISTTAAKLVANKDKLAALKALFVGDADYDETEISWIEQGDLGPLLGALPGLELLKTRGGNDLGFSQAQTHPSLKTLVVETGGMSGGVLRQLGAWKLPALEHLELWTGSDEYGWDGDVGDAAKILSGENLPKLKFLGLMNSMIADDFAQAVVASPLIKRIETLDLSMGTLGDVGAEALLGSADAKAINVNLDHNYISAAVGARFAAEGFTKLTLGSNELDPDYPDERYVSVGE